MYNDLVTILFHWLNQQGVKLHWMLTWLACPPQWLTMALHILGFPDRHSVCHWPFWIAAQDVIDCWLLKTDLQIVWCLNSYLNMCCTLIQHLGPWTSVYIKQYSYITSQTNSMTDMHLVSWSRSKTNRATRDAPPRKSFSNILSWQFNCELL